MRKKIYKNLRSSRWFSPNDVRSFGHRSRAMQMGLGKDDWENKPIIGIITPGQKYNLVINILNKELRMLKRVYTNLVECQ